VEVMVIVARSFFFRLRSAFVQGITGQFVVRSCAGLHELL